MIDHDHPDNGKLRHLKILYVITQGHWGGAQRYVFDLSHWLKDRAEVEVAVGDRPDMELQQRLRSAGIKWRQLKHLQRSINPLADLLAVRELRRLIKQGGYNVIHLNSSKAGAVGALAAAGLPKRLRPKVIYTAHGWVFVEPLAKWRLAWYKFIERTTARWKDIIICVSKMSKDDALQAKVGRPEQLKVIPIALNKEVLNFLPADQARQQLRQLANLPPTGEEIILITIANYYGTKGIDILLSALPPIINQYPQVHSLVLGDGPLKDSLFKLRANLNLQNHVHLPGNIPEAYRLLTGADIFVLPSRKEGLPYALLEALAAGLPIIATEVGAIPSVLGNGQAGLLITPGAAGDLTKAIQTLLENNNLKNKLIAAINSTNRGKNYSLAEMIRQTVACY